MNIVILAAGKGKRMHSRLPKVLQPLAGRPMLDWVLESVSPLAPQGTTVVVGHGAEIVRERYAGRKGVRFALQSEQLGTGHALRCALPQIDPEDPSTLVCLGDEPLLKRSTLERMREKAAGGALVLLTVSLENPSGYGRIIRSAAGDVIAIVEEKDADAAQKAVHEVNTGIMVLPTARLEKWLSELGNANAQGEYYLTDLIGFAVRDGVRIEAVQPDHVWEVEGVNSKAQLAALERTYQKTEAERLMERGVTLIDPARIDVRGELICGEDVEIDVGCVFEGRVVIGSGVRVGPYCVIRDTEIRDGAEILAFSHFDGAVVGPECRVGPYSRLRPGAELEGGNHIGNFVEVKKSTVGLGSKVNHLSYIGDATVGARVNIGAGTITCNYDGVNKFRTVIGDDAFIGSDTQLIAPVKVGAGATLGAGTTLARNAPAGKLTLSRARQVTVEGWKRPVKKQ